MVPWSKVGVVVAASVAALLALLRHYNLRGGIFEAIPLADMNVDLSGKSVIVTGSNRGIGYEMAIAFAKMGATTWMACRSQQNCLEAIAKMKNERGVDVSKVRCEVLDLASFKSIKEFAAKYIATGEPLHALVNNAALLDQGFTEDGLALIMGVNHFGPFLLTMELLPAIQKHKARVVTVSSFAFFSATDAELWKNDIDLKGMNTKGFGDMNNAYSYSKLGNLLFTRELAKRGITALTLHPGFIKTDIANNMPLMGWLLFKFLHETVAADVYHGAQNTIYAATSPNVQHLSGVFFEYFRVCEVEKYNPLTTDASLHQWLWDKSVEITKPTYRLETSQV